MWKRRKKNRLLDKIMRHWLGTITHVATTQPVAALTFDDGPHPKFTPRLLDILADYRAKATFFVVGEMVAQHPTLLRRLIEAGHAICCHSWDHPAFPLLSTCERRQQLDRWAAAVAPYGEQKLFRPPYGAQNFASRFDLWRAGYTVITWNVASGDWLDRPADRLARHILNRLTPGAIVLLHDALYTASSGGSFDRSATLAAVELVLQQTRGQFKFVTVPELLCSGQPQLRNWHREPDVTWLHRLQKQQGQAQPDQQMVSHLL